MEWAVRAGWVTDEAAASDWIHGTLENTFAALDGALFWRMMQALQDDDHVRFVHADAWLAAGRESREMQQEDRRMGEALLRLLTELGVPTALRYAKSELTYPAAFALAAHHWKVTPAAALKGLMWSVMEGQVAAAIRLVPLGHTAGQRILIDGVETSSAA